MATNPNSSNLTSTSLSRMEPEVVSTIRIVISAAICATGIMGNILVLIITACLRKSKTAVNCYILNLAAADIGVLAICYPLTLVKAEDPLRWPLGRVVCEVLYPLSDIFYGVSIGSIVAIAIDRYRAIVCNVQPGRILKSAKWVMLCTWIVAFLGIVLPLYFVMKYLNNADKRTVDCTPVWPSLLTLKLYFVSLTVLWYVLPLVVILWAYRKIAQRIRTSKSLHKSMRDMCGSRQQRNAMRKVSASNTKALKILVPVVMLFVFTMLPFHVFRLMYIFLELKTYKYKWVVYNICTVLLLTNSAANPIIYSLVSEEFKQQFKAILCLNWGVLKSLRSEKRSTKKEAATIQASSQWSLPISQRKTLQTPV